MSRTSEKSAAALASSSAFAAARGQVQLQVFYADFSEEELGDSRVEGAHGASVFHHCEGVLWQLVVPAWVRIQAPFAPA
eukprot:6204277-Pleurochrysis_carterae.AAC.2